MNKKIRKTFWVALALVVMLVFTAAGALAQSYLFTLDELTVDVFVNEDGSASLRYDFLFTNATGAHAIDFVDVGMPTGDFSMSGVNAEVDGAPVQVSRSEYQGSGSGFAVVLGNRAIPPGSSGRVRVYVPRIEPWMRVDSKDPNYASLVFSPVWFGSEYVRGDTQMTVTLHLPPGVKTEEPRWHSAPSGFPSEPAAAIDEQGRITYTWSSPTAQADRQYDFGASFPKQYVPAAAVTDPSISESLGIDAGAFGSCLCFPLAGVAMLFIVLSASRSAAKRKLQYLPPKIAIEGMGIKRGLTAVEAAILMEQPLDKVLTMILFGLVKKGAAQVTQQDPLKVEAITPPPVELLSYEKDFLDAFKKPLKEQRAALQLAMTEIVRAVASKMKGFSRAETLDYYKDIMERAWKQVEAAQTPEIRMDTYDKYMEWTMLDKDYDDRTRRVFTGPVIVPQWWPRYDPTYSPRPSGGGVSTSGPSTSPGGPGGGGFSLPSLPGSAFAASMVRGVQNFSSSVIGNVNEFTSAITNRTNPPPPTPTRSSGGRSGGGCACACACAGCACACAGGGR